MLDVVFVLLFSDAPPLDVSKSRMASQGVVGNIEGRS